MMTNENTHLSPHSPTTVSNGFAVLLFIVGVPHLYGALQSRKHHASRNASVGSKMMNWIELAGLLSRLIHRLWVRV